MGLTALEIEVLRLLWDGCSQKQVAERMGLSMPNMNHLVRYAKRRTGAVSTIALLRRAVKAGILTP